MATVKLIKMTRSEEFAKGGPTEAMVHPDEVENYKKENWTLEKEK